MSNSVKRLLTAAVAVPLIYIIFLIGGYLYLLFFLALILVGQIEYRQLLRTKELPSEGTAGIAFSLLIGLSAYFGYISMSLTFTASVLLIPILCLRKREFNDTLTRMGVTLFGVLYIGWLLSHAILLRDIAGTGNIGGFALESQGLSDVGFFFVVFAVACTFVHDTGAYYTGMLIGKHKLAPNISPGKTIEGTIGGFAACIIAGLVVNYLFGEPLSSDWAVALGLVIAVSAVFGDLVESAIKRGAGIKDSGVIVPRHGGVLDRFDSLIFVFPVTYYFVLVYYKLQGVWF